MRRLILIVLAVSALAVPAEALTIRDVIELTRAGLGDDVLLALIDVDRRVYTIDTETLKALKEAGVSEKVIVALVRSGREQPVEPAPAPVIPNDPEPPEPQVVVIDHRDDEPRVREVPVAVPVYYPVWTTVPNWGPIRRHRTTDPAANFIPFQTGPPVFRPEPVAPKQPLYWGYGGKLRPDAWNPEPPKPPQRQDRRDQ